MAVLMIDPALLKPAIQTIIAGPALLEPAEPPARPPLGQWLLNAVQAALCYSVVVEYVGHRDEKPIPIGVIVLCPGLHYAKALFYRPNLPLPPRSRRWKQVDAFIHNLTQNPPDTLERLEAEIRCQHNLLPARSRVFHFQDVQVRITNPWKLATKLYAEEVLFMKVIEREESLSSSIIDTLVCPDCGDEQHTGPCRMTTHKMIQRHIDQMVEDETTYWLERVQEELPPTHRQLAMQLVGRRVQILAKGNPEKAAELSRFLQIAQDILSI